jgi:hypothetical protein
MKWRRVFAGCWHGFQDGQNNPCAILERNDFGRKLWTVEIVGRGRVTDGVFDCFAIAVAKQIATKALIGGRS